MVYIKHYLRSRYGTQCIAWEVDMVNDALLGEYIWYMMHCLVSRHDI